MRHEYRSRGRLITVEEVEGVFAVKHVRSAGVPGVEWKTLRGAEEIDGGVRYDDWEAFTAAGWIFVRPADPSVPHFNGVPLEETRGVSARVFRDADGRLILGSDRLSVRLRDDMSEAEVQELFALAQLTVIHQLRFAPWLFEVRTAPGVHIMVAVETLSQDRRVEYAEPEFLEHIPLRTTRSDPHYPVQWHLNNTGQDGGIAEADLDMERAWAVTSGAGTRIAFVDNGFDVRHPDLMGALARTSGYFVQDDTGCARFREGLDGMPNNRHGTRCAGVAAARADNGEGGRGVAYQSTFTVIACLDDQLASQLTLARSIAYAADPRQEVPQSDPADGVDVISCSLGPTGAPWRLKPVLADAIDFAVLKGRGGRGTPIFWATDNANIPVAQDEVCSYERTIAVGRSTNRDREDNSAFGPELDFLAPGVNVFTTEAGGGYVTRTGTSLAAPAAAGVAALVLAVNPALCWHQVRDIMRSTCEKVGRVLYDATGRNNDYGFGRVNAALAVSVAQTAGTLPAC